MAYPESVLSEVSQLLGARCGSCSLYDFGRLLETKAECRRRRYFYLHRSAACTVLMIDASRVAATRRISATRLFIIPCHCSGLSFHRAPIKPLRTDQSVTDGDRGTPRSVEALIAPEKPAVRISRSNMKLLLSALLVACVFVLSGCTGDPRGPSKAVDGDGTVDPRVVELFDGQEGLRPVISPIHVEAFRVDSMTSRLDRIDPFRSGAIRSSIAGYRIIGGPAPVDSKTAEDLALILRNVRSYEWDGANGCFEPGVAVRFTGTSSTTEVIFCFKCDRLEIFRSNKHIAQGDFDNARRPLVAIMKRIFPNDGAIRNLN